MFPVLWFWFAQVGARVLAWVLPRWQARNDQRLIRENGAADSLHDTFHRQKLTFRVGLLLTAGVVAWWPLLGHGGVWGLLAFSLAALALFGRVFNARLNVARNKPKWYVSLDPKAARFDRTLVAIARSQLSHELAGRRSPSSAEVSIRAAHLLETYSRWVLWVLMPIDVVLWVWLGVRFTLGM